MDRNKTSLTNIQKRLILSNAFRAVFEIFMSTFIIVLIVNAANNPELSTGFFQILNNFFVWLGFVVLAKFIKRSINSRMICYRIGLAFAILLLCVMVFFNTMNNLYLIATFFGTYAAFFWSAYNTLIADILTPKQMTKFANYDETVKGMVKVIAPLCLGFLITYTSFSLTAALIIPMMCATLFLSFDIKDNGKVATNNNCIEFGRFWKIAHKNRHILRTYFIEFLLGITTYGAMLTITTMYATKLFGTPDSVGAVISIAGIVMIVAQFFIARYGQAQHQIKLLGISGIAFFIVAAIFFVMENQFVFIIYNAIYVLMYKFLNTTCTMFMFKGLDVAKIDARYNTEYMVIRESFLNAGRFVGFGALIFVGMVDFASGLKYLLLSMVLCLAVIMILIFRINKEHGQKF